MRGLVWHASGVWVWVLDGGFWVLVATLFSRFASSCCLLASDPFVAGSAVVRGGSCFVLIKKKKKKKRGAGCKKTSCDAWERQDQSQL